MVCLPNSQLCHPPSSSPRSEGRGLSHKDKRSYLGRINVTEDGRGRRTLFVRGSVVFGKDFGSDTRPQPVGSFSMMEVGNIEHSGLE